MMMVEADEGSPVIMDELFSGEDDFNDVFIDLDAFWRVVGGPPDPPQDSSLEDLHLIDTLAGLQTSKAAPSTKDELPGFGVLTLPHNSEASDSRRRCSDGFQESTGNSSVRDDERLEPSSWRQGNGLFYTHADGASHNASSSCQNDNLYPKKLIEETNLGTSDAPMEYSSHVDGDRSSWDASHTGSNSCEITATDVSDMLSENGDLDLWRSDDPPYFPYSYGFKSFAHDDGIMDEEKNHMTRFEDLVRSKVGQNPMIPVEDLVRSRVGANTMTPYEDLVRNKFGQNPTTTMEEFFRSQVGQNPMAPSGHLNTKCASGGFFSLDSDFGITQYCHMPAMGNESKKPSPSNLSNEDNKIQGIKWSSSNSLSSIFYENYVPQSEDEKEGRSCESRKTFPSLGMAGETPLKNSAAVAYGWCPEQPGLLPPPSIEAETNHLKMEKEVQKSNDCYLSKITYQGVQDKTFDQRNINDDPDVCILEDMSAPARPNRIAMNAKLVAASQHLTSRDPGNQMVTAHSRAKPNDERVIFRVALQDLSQPKSEATPPDGVLSVPLLKHQRIALSWMVNKETKSACCSGGILADDQGLGKTISTIALILKERSPSSKAPKINERQSEMETLNLDEDDEGASETYHVTDGAEDRQVNGCPVNGGKTFLQTKGRPSGGTLIVCPTSVLRQWAEELHNKVTSEADLSVLVYYGSNRTKDPLELAKYDVVITTYAIVSMEVPKQPVVNENDDQIGSQFKEFSSSRKRKLLETAPDKRSSMCKKSRKGIDNELLENISGPLAKVGWFRVVLDEAQSIKNHRTQVARACWGLRAKRRWCLSGTPIQNAIDDLYSYFRFLRHEPYAVFRTFCDQLKAPIHRNPRNGYKKLQAVLKTIMLRRTKGTRIDGEPIINLPPKTIELKKVDFSKEERDFYCRLEADSRAQFAEYAAAGTVKQNYVNILLMLLRLRQACDHPLLVKGFNANSKMTSSIEMAKELPQEKQVFLLNCLEASLAICGICSDPPEDAVVTVCGHVFCNQCISEHIIVDGTQCPTKKCKTHLSTSHVFSKITLRTALSDQPSMENTTSCSDSEAAEVSEPHSLRCPEDSSKIKAALDLLLSLSKPQDCVTKLDSSELIEDNRTSDMNKDSNNSVKVVGEKAIVFSQWTGMLDLLEACLKNSSIQYRRLDGTMPVAARDRAVKDFKTLPQVSVMIMSLKAASLGLNLVAASNVLLLDLWWNPTTEDQAIDRAHRIGQTRPVSVFRLTVKDTVEDRILALQQRKRKMVASAFGENETGSRQTRLTVEDLKYLFRVD